MNNIYDFPEREKKKVTFNVSITLAILLTLSFIISLIYKELGYYLVFVNQQEIFSKYIWTFLSWPLFDNIFWNIIINVLLLFIFGIKIENKMGSGKFFSYIAAVTILTSIFSYVLGLVLDQQIILFRFSPIIYALLIAMAVYAPESDMMFLGIIKLNVWIILLLFAAFDIVPIIFSSNWFNLIGLITPVLGYLILWITWKRSPYHIWKDSKEEYC